MPHKTFRRVALARAGSHSASTGKVSLTLEDLRDMLEASRDPQTGRTVIKIGHLDPRFKNPQHDGEPVYGQVQNLELDGEVLYGDLVNVPEQLAEAMPSAYPSRSVEIAFNFRTRAGKVLRRVLTAVALLGDTRPAIKDLDDVVAAHAAEGGDPADNWQGFVALAGFDDGDVPPLTAAAPDDAPVVTQGGSMTNPIPAALLEKLGLPADADEAAVLAAVEALKAPAAPPADPPVPAGTTAPAGQAPAADPPPLAVAASEGQVITAAQVATFAEMETRLAELQERDATRSAAEQAARIDAVIHRFSADPVDGGRVTPHTEPLWRTQLARDLDGTVALLAASPRLYSPTSVGSALAPDSTDAATAAKNRAKADARALGLRTYEQAGA